MKVEETIQFILDQQVQLNNILIELAGAQERTSELVARLAERQVATETNLNALTELFAQHQTEFAQHQTEFAQHQAEFAKQHAELAERQKTTEQNLNTLIIAVERHLSGHD